VNASDGLRERKRAVRIEMKAALARLAPGSCDAQGRATALRLQELPDWGAARTVYAFLAMAAELCSDYCCAAALSAGKTLLLPRVDGDELDFRVCADLAGPWRPGPFGIREPRDEAPAIIPEAASGPVLVLAPGLAFDEKGGRLGRGKGYFDRFLRKLRSARPDVLVFGLCLEAQIVREVPMGPLDERMDGLVTGLRFRDFRGLDSRGPVSLSWKQR